MNILDLTNIVKDSRCGFAYTFPPRISNIRYISFPNRVMVHLRANERVSNPNPYINFIASLEDADDATELLRALAAQVRPIMRDHSLTVNSFEEYENNKVFLGRNWNNGETIELVLRDATSQFYSTSRLLSVLCHELAHIKHMNHSSAFHKFRRQLCAEIAALQRRGYFGDGYWSAGTRLRDSQRIAGSVERAQELPEYTCGGAFSQSRREVIPSRPRQARQKAGPSSHTGAQTVRQRKAGSRITSKSAFRDVGTGHVLDTSIEKGGEDSTFRKKASSKKAREKRALLAERRLLEMQGKTVPEPNERSTGSEIEGEEEEASGLCYERAAPETDRERLERMRYTDDLYALRDDDDDIVILENKTCGSFDGDKMQEREIGYLIDKSDTNKKRSADPMEPVEPVEGKTKCRRLESTFSLRDSNHSNQAADFSHSSSSTNKVVNHTKMSGLFGKMASEEMQQRKREAIGLDKSYKLGTDKSLQPEKKAWSCEVCTFENPSTASICAMCESRNIRPGVWACYLCTFENTSDRHHCEACNNPR